MHRIKFIFKCLNFKAHLCISLKYIDFCNITIRLTNAYLYDGKNDMLDSKLPYAFHISHSRIIVYAIHIYKSVRACVCVSVCVCVPSNGTILLVMPADTFHDKVHDELNGILAYFFNIQKTSQNTVKMYNQEFLKDAEYKLPLYRYIHLNIVRKEN